MAPEETLIKFKSYCVTARVYAAQTKPEPALINYDEALKVAQQELERIEDNKEATRDFGLKKEMSWLYMDRVEALIQHSEFYAAIKSLQQGFDFFRQVIVKLKGFSVQDSVPLFSMYKKIFFPLVSLQYIGYFGFNAADKLDGENSATSSLGHLITKIVHSHVIDDTVEVTEKIEEKGPHHLLPDLYQFIAMSYSAKHQSNDALMYYHKSLEIKR